MDAVIVKMRDSLLQSGGCRFVPDAGTGKIKNNIVCGSFVIKLIIKRADRGEKDLTCDVIGESIGVFLALDGSQVVGYLDVTYCFEENEPYDLFVCEAYRRRGYARALLTRAIEANGEKKLSVLVDRDDAAALGVYASMGFEEDPSARSRTAHLNL